MRSFVRLLLAHKLISLVYMHTLRQVTFICDTQEIILLNAESSLSRKENSPRLCACPGLATLHTVSHLSLTMTDSGEKEKLGGVKSRIWPDSTSIWLQAFVFILQHELVNDYCITQYIPNATVYAMGPWGPRSGLQRRPIRFFCFPVSIS